MLARSVLSGMRDRHRTRRRRASLRWSLEVMPISHIGLRSDPEYASEILDLIFDGRPADAKRAYLELLAEDVDHLSPQYADRWGISLFPDMVRLNVGWVNCLVLTARGLSVLVKGGPKPDTGWPYKKAPECTMKVLTLAGLSRSWRRIVEPHQRALSTAAGWTSHRGVRRAHSPGITRLLSERLGHPIPDPSYLAPVQLGRDYTEGGPAAMWMDRFERNPAAREACISAHGSRCAVCEMSFGDVYGITMKGLIHVHHVTPVSQTTGKHKVDPVSDMLPVCPNCHAVIHWGPRPLTVEEVRALLLPGRGRR